MNIITYKIRGSFSQNNWEFADKKDFQKEFVEGEWGHIFDLKEEVGNKIYNKLKSYCNPSDYINLQFVVGQNQDDSWFLINNSVKFNTIIKDGDNQQVIKHYSKSIENFGVDDTGKPLHRLAYSYINYERIQKGQMPKTFKEYLQTSALLLNGMTAQEIVDTKNSYK